MLCVVLVEESNTLQGNASQPTPASKPADGTTAAPTAKATATKAKAIPRTKDETTPLIAVLLAGFVALTAGILARKRPALVLKSH